MHISREPVIICDTGDSPMIYPYGTAGRRRQVRYLKPGTRNQMQRAVWELCFRRLVTAQRDEANELDEHRFGADVTEGDDSATVQSFE